MIWRILYVIALTAAMPYVLLRLWWRGRREPGYRRHVGERFGLHRTAGDLPVIWVHAVSVGEVRGSAALVRAIAAAVPRHRILLTCTTAAGRAMAEQVHGDALQIAFLPYDLPGSVSRFLRRVRPAVAIIVETEIWPVLFAACRNRAIPVVLVNARLSRRSARGYARIAPLMRPALAAVRMVCAQDRGSARRLSVLGARSPRVLGNLKFDAAVDPAQLADAKVFRETQQARPIVVLASTREGEERALLDALATGGRELVVLVPRHPQRFDAVAQLATAAGWRVIRRSAGAVPDDSPRQLVLGDTMGEMGFYYGIADVAVIGGSFQPLGGQNLIEACAVGAPVVIGPSSYNFAEATRWAIAAGAAVQVANARAAAEAVQDLIANPAQRARMSEAGLRLCARHRGATGRHLETIKTILSETS